MANATKVKSPKAQAKADAKAKAKAEKKKARHDKLKAQSRALASRNSHQLRPLMINGSALTTSVLLHEISPTIGAAFGLSAAAVTAVNAWLGRLSENERKHIAVHGLSAAAWSALAGLVGFTPMVDVAGLVGLIASHLTWHERRGVRKQGVSERATSNEWNAVSDEGDDRDGILARAGWPGARMFYREPITDAKDTQIGFRYHIDISEASTTADAFVVSAPAMIAKHLPGRTRKGAVTAHAIEEDVNHVYVDVIWRKQWSMETSLLHPIVQHLPELTELVHCAIEHHQSGGATEPIVIPRHLRRLMPGMATVRDPILKGFKADQSYATETIFKKGYGPFHKFGVGKSGSGKTSDINSEIASLMPCRDAIVWAIDVSAKRGKHFAPWGSCIDWLATEIPDANAMLKAIVNIINARGRHPAYRTGAVVSPKTAPTIVLIIDELPALWEALGSERMNKFLANIARQARAQGVRLELWGQRGVQTDYGNGFHSVITQCDSRTLLKVLHETEAGYVLNNAELVQNDVTAMLPGEGIDQDAETGEMTHRRGWLVREGDDEADEGTFEALGDIPAIAALYAPFRPKLDAVSAQAAGEAYANRKVFLPDNPLLTPEEVVTPRVTVEPPVSEDDQDAVISQLRTNISWLDAMLDGRLSVPGITAITDDGEAVMTDEDDSQMDIAELDTASVLLDLGIPTGESDAAREQRGEMMRAQLDKQLAGATAELDELTSAIATIEPTVTVAEAAGRDEAPQAFPDDDPIIRAALEIMGRQGSKGAPVGEIVAALGKAGKTPSSETVRARLRDLANRNKAVLAGSGRGARWYLTHHAPKGGDK
ncbi:hypothetical protein GCM10027258_79580 [Amycolatopsis stemonae]